MGNMIVKDNLQQTFDRLLAYAERRLGQGILASVGATAPSTGNADAQAEGGIQTRECLLLADLAGCVRQTESSLRDFFPAALRCDYYPVVNPTMNFGESIWSGLLGAPITFAGTRSHTWSYCAAPPLEDFSRFPFAPLDPANYWYRKMLEVTGYYVKHLPSRCDISPFIFMDCLNLLVELRGATQAYLDLYENAEIIPQFLDWSVDVNCALYDAQAELARDFTTRAFGGHPFHRYSGACIPNLSIDAYGLCAAEIYRKWGLEQHRRVVNRYGGGRLHIHGNGRHLCELVAQNTRLTSCNMGDDVGYPPAWTIVRKLRDRMTPVPIEVNMPLDAFLQGLSQHTLPAGVYYHTMTDSLADANRIMDQVFEYRE